MKISVCITVLNEEKYILNLLDSLIGQTKKADQIIIVDGGSTDNTLSVITKFLSQNSKKTQIVKLLKYQNSTIAQGRNAGINKAGGDIIALTDAGCVPKQDWLEKLTDPFNIHLGGVHSNTPEVNTSLELVAGFYTMPYLNYFQEAARLYLGIPPERYNPTTFLPSARSVAFRKSVWKSLGGFNEKLETAGEDTRFFYDCVKSGVKMVRVEEATVDWVEIKDMNLRNIAKKFYVYAKGDGQTNIWWHPNKQLSSHNIKIVTIYMRYIVGVSSMVYGVYNPGYLPIPVILVILYLLFPIWKWHDVIKGWKSRLWLPVIQIISDIQVMRGFLVGIINK